MSEQSKDTDHIPKSIGKFKIVGKLGKGGMGDIYKAIQPPNDRMVALKVLPPQFSRDDEFSKRFAIEGKAISLLQHQNIVTLYESGEADGYSFFAMQYVEGEDLGKRIFRSKAMPVDDIVDISKQICRGLRYAHAKNVVHRDIKPQNILIDKNNTVRISDFGIAKIYAHEGITMTGMAVGTPEYMSPEQAEGVELDAQTDIYSLGILMYEMITKKPPFTGNNPVAIAYKQVHENPAPPSTRRKDIPKRLELIVLKALKKNKEERYRTVEEMLEHLDSVDINELVDSPTSSLPAVGGKPAEKNGQSEKRITDRRSGDRRYLNRPFGLQTRAGWENLFLRLKDAIAQQALTLILIALLAIIVLHHIYSTSPGKP
ncbi:MAG: serine/threonine-protein kinase [Chitinivibrionales bacterium]|nr:serine/threonine-protein kinase [Chitinivibrionales bacterium]